MTHSVEISQAKSEPLDADINKLTMVAVEMAIHRLNSRGLLLNQGCSRYWHCRMYSSLPKPETNAKFLAFAILWWTISVNCWYVDTMERYYSHQWGCDLSLIELVSVPYMLVFHNHGVSHIQIYVKKFWSTTMIIHITLTQTKKLTLQQRRSN